jgi:hypothetical protein
MYWKFRLLLREAIVPKASIVNREYVFLGVTYLDPDNRVDEGIASVQCWSDTETSVKYVAPITFSSSKPDFRRARFYEGIE